MMSLAEQQTASADTMVVTADMVADTDARCILTVNGVEAPLAEDTDECVALTRCEAYGTANELVQVSGGFSFGRMEGFDPSQMDDYDPS